MARFLRLALLGVAVLGCGCRGTVNYFDVAGPRFAGSYAGASAPPGIRVVSFNVKYARNIPGAVALLKYDPRLAPADVILLQEMDEAGTDCVARALGANYVYYPAGVHRGGGKNFGNAIVSRWPIADDRKLVLPHRGRFTGMARIAVGATVTVRDLPVRVYSAHLETIASLSGSGRREQAEALRADALGHPHVVIAGDFNARKVVEEVFGRAEGFDWVTRHVGRTIARFSWDHVIVRGFRLRDCASFGAVPNPMRASDHVPVWADVVPVAAALDRPAAGGVQSADCGGPPP